MTLIITLLTERTVYQSADFRLTDPNRVGAHQIITDTSTKLVTLQYTDWDGFVAYTGIGRWSGRDTSEFLIEWLTGLDGVPPSALATRIQNEGTEWLRVVERVTSRRWLHTFILAAFKAGRPQVAVISNFEDCVGRCDSHAESSLQVSVRRFTGRPLVIVVGQKRAVSRAERHRLEHLGRDAPDDPARVRRRLAEMNEEAARSPAAQGTVSPTCSVVSVRADGRGVTDLTGKVSIRVMAFGMPLPDHRELTRMFGPGYVVGMTFASSKRPLPFAPCQPHTVTPADAAEYVVREMAHSDFVSCRAFDISDLGVVLGDGNPPGRPGDYLVWTAPRDGDPKCCGFIGNPGGINDAGEVAGEAKMTDGAVHAVRWREQALTDLGCYRGRDGAGTAINAAGVVVGWVCVDPANRGQGNFRPAAWTLDKLYVLESFGGWGQAIDVNDHGIVLVVAYMGQQCRAVHWDSATGASHVIGNVTGIYPMAITNHGIVLGKATDRDGKSVAVVATPGQRWEALGTPAGFYATAINDAGDVVGAAVRDGFERPWLRRASGELVWLPYYDHHWCRPSAINNAGVIVGTAQTDHGTHALIWMVGLGSPSK